MKRRIKNFRNFSRINENHEEFMSVSFDELRDMIDERPEQPISILSKPGEGLSYIIKDIAKDLDLDLVEIDAQTEDIEYQLPKSGEGIVVVDAIVVSNVTISSIFQNMAPNWTYIFIYKDDNFNGSLVNRTTQVKLEH